MAGFTVGTDRVDCRVWINFSGSGSVSIRDDYNVSSITDNGTGNYTVVFTESLGNNIYAASVCCGGVGGSGSSFTYTGTQHSAATGSCGVNTTAYNIGTALGDTTLISFLVFGN